MRKVVSLHPAHFGLETISLDDAREVLRWRPATGRPVIVLDPMLPITDGFTAFANLRRHPETARMPIVVISGNPDALTRARAPVGDRGAVVLLRKPFTLAELQAAVRAAMGSASGDMRRVRPRHDRDARGLHRDEAPVSGGTMS